MKPRNERLAKAVARTAGRRADPDSADDTPVVATTQPPVTAGIALIAHDLIVPDALNPRKSFDPVQIEELADTIAANGLLQNLVVRPAAPMEGRGEVHRLVAGERRWRAISLLVEAGRLPASLAGGIPCRIAELDDGQHAAVALLENLARRDLTPLEEARGFRRLVDDHGYTTASIAEKIGFGQRMVQQRLQLLDLDETRQNQLEAGRITLEEARRILAQPKPAPIELTAAETVAYLEICTAKLKAGRGQDYSGIPVDYRAAQDPVIKALANRDIVRLGEDWNTGVTELSTGYLSGSRLTVQLFGGWDQVAKEDRLRQALSRAYQALEEAADVDTIEAISKALADGRYLSQWLNEPHEISPDKVGEIARRAEEARKDKARRAEDDRIRKEEMARRRELEKQAPVKAVGLATSQDRAADLGALMQQAGHPLPWRWTLADEEDAGELTDADGKEISLDWDADYLMPLIMAAVNLVGGCAPVLALRKRSEVELQNFGLDAHSEGCARDGYPSHLEPAEIAAWQAGWDNAAAEGAEEAGGGGEEEDEGDDEGSVPAGDAFAAQVREAMS